MTRDPALAAAIEEMLSRQLAGRGIRDPRVLAAMARVPRELFVDLDTRDMAFADRALPIGCAQTISQPYIVALMSEALALKGTERVLEIGTGSGYQTAVLAELASYVVSIERHRELAELAASRLERLGYANIELHHGDGSLGWPAGAPYDGILVAAATERCPAAFVEQLASTGRIVIPLGPDTGQMLTLLENTPSGLRATDLTECRFVPLVHGGPP